MIMDTNDGIVAVQYAKSVIADEVFLTRLSYDFQLPDSFNEPTGVFVTINTYPGLALRGCIGFPEPSYPLRDAIEYSARSACHDPRFLDLQDYELRDVVVEVTVLTQPEPIIVRNREDLLSAVKIGRDGLMLEYRGRRSVFLPRVPGDWGWDVKEYLENLCQKAGIGKDKWKENDCFISSFRGKIFKETSPDGDIVEVDEC